MIKNYILANNFTFFTFIVFFSISDFIFFQFTREISLNYGFDANLIYMAHGVRVLSLLIFGIAIIPGLILGQFTSGIFLKCQADLNIYEFLNICSLDPKTLIILLIGSILTIISVVLSYYFLKLNLIKNLNQVSIFKILNFIFLSSILNSILTNLFFGLIYTWNLALNTALYIIGDSIGAFVLFFLIKLFYKTKFYFK